MAEEFWSLDWDAFAQEAKRLNSGPAVVVVDPIALYHPAVEYAYTQQLGKFFERLRHGPGPVLDAAEQPAAAGLMAVLIFKRFLTRRC